MSSQYYLVNNDPLLNRNVHSTVVPRIIRNKSLQINWTEMTEKIEKKIV